MLVLTMVANLSLGDSEYICPGLKQCVLTLLSLARIVIFGREWHKAHCYDTE